MDNKTLYINNLNEKHSRLETKKLMNMIFSQYGKVSSIDVSKGLKLRGQAWVAFKDAASASRALRGKQGFNFFGKPMKIQFANHNSKRVEKREEKLQRLQEKRKRKLSDGESGDEERDDEAGSNAPTKKAAASKALLVRNVPSGMTEEVLSVMLSQYAGMVGVSLEGPGQAVVSFSTPAQASAAHRQLHGSRLGDADEPLDASFHND